jgi:hypothetical protein
MLRRGCGQKMKNTALEHLVLARHFAVVAKFVFLVNSHDIRLRCHGHHVVAFFVLVIHGAVIRTETIGVAVDIFSTIGVHKDTKTLNSDTAEDTENFALVVIELGRCFATKGEEIFT